jgi:hypothetical protein
MLPIELLRRWGVPILGLALLIVGVVLLAQGSAVPADSAAYTTPGAGGTSPETKVIAGWIMTVLGAVLCAGWLAVMRRLRGNTPPTTD